MGSGCSPTAPARASCTTRWKSGWELQRIEAKSKPASKLGTFVGLRSLHGHPPVQCLPCLGEIEENKQDICQPRFLGPILLPRVPVPLEDACLWKSSNRKTN